MTELPFIFLSPVPSHRPTLPPLPSLAPPSHRPTFPPWQRAPPPLALARPWEGEGVDKGVAPVMSPSRMMMLAP
jgi:hypothetical protein